MLCPGRLPSCPYWRQIQQWALRSCPQAFGSYSTVWLARDSEQDKFVALKIIVADASTNNSESKILSRLALGDAEHPGRTHVATLVDEFFVTGPNGRHRCIVADAAGCSIAESKEASMTWMFPADVAREIIVGVLQALAYTHSCRVVHGGRLGAC
jgi:serine/threonine-protein kinase SRPK3